MGSVSDITGSRGTLPIPPASLAGKRGIIVGIANDSSIAWGCAKAMRACGAELALSYLNDKAKPYVEPLAQSVASSDPNAKAAIELFVYRIVREAGSLAAALGGLDALVFTGGIGEHAEPVRAAVCRDLRWLGEFAVAVIPTDEEAMIARHTLRLLAPGGLASPAHHAMSATAAGS